MCIYIYVCPSYGCTSALGRRARYSSIWATHTHTPSLLNAPLPRRRQRDRQTRFITQKERGTQGGRRAAPGYPSSALLLSEHEQGVRCFSGRHRVPAALGVAAELLLDLLHHEVRGL